tara:strand:- start:184 stop:903 length:720 start_codon:yes stop_codon:yes gene_type:complete
MKKELENKIVKLFNEVKRKDYFSDFEAEREYKEIVKTSSVEDIAGVVKNQIRQYLDETDNDFPFISGWTYWGGCDMNDEFNNYHRTIDVMTGNWSDLCLSHKLYESPENQKVINRLHGKLVDRFFIGYALSAVSHMLKQPDTEWGEMDHGNPISTSRRTMQYWNNQEIIGKTGDQMQKIGESYSTCARIIREGPITLGLSNAREQLNYMMREELPKLQQELKSTYNQMTTQLRGDLETL